MQRLGIAPATLEHTVAEFGYRIKLLGVARRTKDGIEQRVHPAMVRARTPLADVESSFNAVVAVAGEAGPYFFEGRGAGQGPTASAVVSVGASLIGRTTWWALSAGSVL